MIHPFEDGFHSVIINLRNRVEFVIMTTGTIERESQERLPDGPDDFFKLFFARL